MIKINLLKNFKLCSTCKILKPLKDFRLVFRKLCPRSQCRKCERKYTENWLHTTEKGKACHKRWRSKPVTKRKLAEYHRKWRKTVHGEIYTKEYIKNTAEKRKEYICQWKKSEKAKALMKLWDRRYGASEKGKIASKKKSARYRALKLGNIQILLTFTNEQWKMLLNKFDFQCAYCGINIQNNPTMDHVIPLSKGGQHTSDNIVPACKSCNSKKQGNIWEPNYPKWIN